MVGGRVECGTGEGEYGDRVRGAEGTHVEAGEGRAIRDGMSGGGVRERACGGERSREWRGYSSDVECGGKREVGVT